MPIGWSMNKTMIQMSDYDNDCGDLLEDVDLETVLVAAKEQSVDPCENELDIYFLYHPDFDGHLAKRNCTWEFLFSLNYSDFDGHLVKMSWTVHNAYGEVSTISSF